MLNLTHTLDLAGAASALLSTVYYVKADIRAWPIGLISSVFNVVLFAITGLYGDMGCEMVYCISMLYGWFLWTHPRENQTELPITHIQGTEFWTLGSIAIVSIFSLRLFLAKYTPSHVPLWDATTTVLALSAQWMTCKKIIECWCLWFIVDGLYIGLYFHKGIPAHGILFSLYLGLAIAGFLNWRNMACTSEKNVYAARP